MVGAVGGILSVPRVDETAKQFKSKLRRCIEPEVSHTMWTSANSNVVHVVCPCSSREQTTHNVQPAPPKLEGRILIKHYRLMST